MRKISTFLILLLALVMLAVPVLAAQTAVLTVTASNQSLDKGDTVVITVSTSKVDSCESGGFLFSFDKNVFEYVSGESALSSKGYMAGVSTAAGNVAGYFMNSTQTVQGEIFKITLRVKDTAAYGTYTVTGTPNLKSGGAVVESSVSEVTVTVACRHEYSKYEFVNDSTHKYTCSKCGDVQEGSHRWDDEAISVKPSCEQEGEKEKTCLDCGSKSTSPVPATGHAWDNACDTDCNNGCGLTRTTEHTYEETFTSDGDGHWYACSICGDKKDFAAHTPGPEATTTAAQVCLVCNYEIVPQKTHNHQMSQEWLTDDTYHWHRCQWNGPPSCHYVEDKAEHDYDNDCDVDCNTCGYIRLDAPHNYREEWLGDQEGHWYVCVDCNGQSETKAHIPGPEATDTEPQRCKECNIVIQMPLSHEHGFGDLWYYDDESHWQCCNDPICFEVTEAVPHTWDEGLDMASGGKQFTCTVCGKQMETEGPAPTVPTTQPTTQPTTAPQKADDNQSKGGFSWEWIAIAALLLLAIGFILLIIEFVRSRKRNSHGRFSK